MAFIQFSEAELRRFSPGMKPYYRDTLLSDFGKGCLREAGILDNAKHFCHFMGQFGGETRGGELLRENLNYTTVAAIRRAWPARSSRERETALKALLRNPEALADWAYGGRMGNRKGTSDGYDHRGGGWLQTTGKANVTAWCAKIGIELRPDILDDPETTLRFACFAWQEGGCNDLADANDLVGVSTAINTGSATSGVRPNGMDHRQTWFDKAHATWGDAEPVEDHAQPPPAPTHAAAGALSGMSFAKVNDLADQGSRIATKLQQFKRWLWGSAVGTGTAAASIDTTTGTGAAIKSLVSEHPFLVLAGVIAIVGAIAWVGLKIVERYLLTAANDGRYTPRGKP